VTGTIQVVAADGTADVQKPPVSPMQKNVVKTMIYVTTCFGICWTPMLFYIMSSPFNWFPRDMIIMNAFYVLGYINLVLNPFLYAAHYEVVKNSWRSFLARLKIGHSVAESVDMQMSTTANR
jgi:hypothetical protein